MPAKLLRFPAPKPEPGTPVDLPQITIRVGGDVFRIAMSAVISREAPAPAKTAARANARSIGEGRTTTNEECNEGTASTAPEDDHIEGHHDD
jgi:hypothetical protein